MIHPAFFDTNILVYTDDEDFPEKQKRAVDLFESYRTSWLFFPCRFCKSTS
jgi:hypothetical protein